MLVFQTSGIETHKSPNAIAVRPKQYPGLNLPDNHLYCNIVQIVSLIFLG